MIISLVLNVLDKNYIFLIFYYDGKNLLNFDS